MPGIFIFVACILAILIFILPKLIQARIWVLRKMHLFKLADWHERNQIFIVKIVRIVFTVFIIILLLLTVAAV